MSYRPYLDGLRAIAVLAVVLYHAHVPGISGGFVGVDVFFVLSGYLITGLLLAEIETTGTISIARFVERRVRRLAPAFFVVLLATLVAGLIWLSPIGGEQQGLARSAIAAVLLSANHYFWWFSGGYFDAPTESLPLLHTWTLSVEEQFYLLWPWLLLLVCGWARRSGQTPQRGATVLIAAVMFGSLAACLWFTPGHQQLTFFLMPFRAWEFALGGAVFLVLRGARPNTAVSAAIAWFGLAAVIAAGISFNDDTVFPGWRAVLPVLGSAALIYGCEANPNGRLAKWLAWRPLVSLGLISYGFYLWHWPALTIARVSAIDEFGLGASLAVCVGAAGLAGLSYRYIEQPIRNQRSHSLPKQKRTLIFGGAAMAGLVIAALGLGLWAKLVWPALPGNEQKAARIVATRKPDWGCEEKSTQRAADGSAKGCVVGTSGPIKILLWGDSHAGQLKPVLEALAAARGVTALLRYAPSCPPALGFSRHGRADEVADCLSFNVDVQGDVRSRRGIDMVILNARWTGYLNGRESEQALLAGLETTVAELRTEGAQVVLVAPAVDFPHRIPACLTRRSEEHCELSQAQALQRRQAAMAVIDKLSSAYPDITVIDPITSLCTPTRCPVRKGENVLYSDSHHLSIAGAEALIPAFLAAQERLLMPLRSVK